jgi:methyltransferase (TIGR00027 family)
MGPSSASRTALAASIVRALHTRADPKPILDDDWGDRLGVAGALEALEESAFEGEGGDAVRADGGTRRTFLESYLRGGPSYCAIITRSRYAEDALHAAVARGVRQYVLIGAGFDSYALRTPEDAKHVEIFELDHPATQALKRSRLAECGVRPGGNVHFIAADLSNEEVGAALKRSRFDASKPAFFSWLGVTMYLTREANLACLRSVADCAAEGSEIVFTYIDQAAFSRDAKSATDAFSRVAAAVNSAGEPFVSGFDPETLACELHELGIELVEDCTSAQLVERYDPTGANAFMSGRLSHAALARVVANGPRRKIFG